MTEPLGVSVVEAKRTIITMASIKALLAPV
jgi:hypothetical protein